ncbi:hypothetical protein [Amycolatopsis sp. NPDC054798]
MEAAVVVQCDYSLARYLTGEDHDALVCGQYLLSVGGFQVDASVTWTERGRGWFEGAGDVRARRQGPGQAAGFFGGGLEGGGVGPGREERCWACRQNQGYRQKQPRSGGVSAGIGAGQRGREFAAGAG